LYLFYVKLAAGGDQGVLYIWHFASLSSFDGVRSAKPANKFEGASNTPTITVQEPAQTFVLKRAIQQILIHDSDVLVLACNAIGN
jgi:hypothetical protein